MYRSLTQDEYKYAMDDEVHNPFVKRTNRIFEEQ